jgi:hypothetical protein
VYETNKGVRGYFKRVIEELSMQILRLIFPNVKTVELECFMIDYETGQEYHLSPTDFICHELHKPLGWCTSTILGELFTNISYRNKYDVLQTLDLPKDLRYIIGSYCIINAEECKRLMDLE